MIRLLFQGVTALALLFCALLGAIVAQPRDDAALRAFFAPPDDCAAPCFLGIRPGETTREQVLVILRAHPWIRFIDITPNGIAWTWNGMQPIFVPSYTTPWLEFDGNVVARVNLVTAVPLAAFRFAFGQPDDQGVSITSVTSTHGYTLLLDAVYTEQAFEIETITECPFKTRDDLWYSTVFITWPMHEHVITDPSNGLKNC